VIWLAEARSSGPISEIEDVAHPRSGVAPSVWPVAHGESAVAGPVHRIAGILGFIPPIPRSGPRIGAALRRHIWLRGGEAFPHALPRLAVRQRVRHAA